MSGTAQRLAIIILVGMILSASCGSGPETIAMSRSTTQPSVLATTTSSPTAPISTTTTEPGSVPVGVYHYTVRTSVMLPQPEPDGSVAWEKLYHHQEFVMVDPENHVARIKADPFPVISTPRTVEVSRASGVTLEEAKTAGNDLVMTDDGVYVQLTDISGPLADWIVTDWDNEWASWDLRFRITDIAERLGAPVPESEVGQYNHILYRFDVAPQDAEAAMAQFGIDTSLVSWRPGQVEVPYEAAVDYYPDGQLNTIIFQSAAGTRIEIFEISLRGTNYGPIEIPLGAPTVVAFSE